MSYSPLPESYLMGRYNAGRLLEQIYADNPSTPHSEGITYLFDMPNGLLKIGYTTDLAKRRSSTGACEILSTLPGGETLELIIQWRLRDFRLPVVGELFVRHQSIFDEFNGEPIRSSIPEARENIQLRLCKMCTRSFPLDSFPVHCEYGGKIYLKGTCSECISKVGK